MKRLLVALLFSVTLSAQAEIDPKVRQVCLPAVDFEGCVRSYSNLDGNKNIEKLDFLGKPIIPGWKVYEQRSENAITYLNDLNTTKVKVRGQFGRYISFDYVSRWYQEPKAGTSGSSTTTGSAITSCYGGSYSINCTTTSPTTINIPGRPAIPGGVRQEKVNVIIDCLDETFKQFGDFESKKWFKLSKLPYVEGVANRYCNKISSLQPSNFIKWEEGSPTEKDNLAIEVLSNREDEQFIGVGISLQYDSDRGRPRVLEVIYSTPAFISGIKGQDLIMKIDGKSTRRMNMDEITSLLRGREGTVVTIELERDGSLLEIPITRAKFKL